MMCAWLLHDGIVSYNFLMFIVHMYMLLCIPAHLLQSFFLQQPPNSFENEQSLPPETSYKANQQTLELQSRL